MPRSKSIRDDRSNLELAHHRMMTIANTRAHFAVLLVIAAIPLFTGVYLYLETINIEVLRITASFLSAVPFLWHAKIFAQTSIKYSNTARAIELELYVDKTLKKYRIHEPLSKRFKEPSKRSR